jgi:dihydrofolate reductase
MTVTAIAAVSENGVLGIDNGLPWHLPADLARFKSLTHGHHLIVGRRTWESVGKPLPGRTFVVVSRSPAPAGWERFWVPTVAEAIAAARATGDAQPFVAGGTGIFREAFERDLVDRIELTRVHADVEGDTFFPEFDAARFRESARVEQPADARNRFAITFVTLDRVDRA